MKYIIITGLLLWGCTTTKPIVDTEWEAEEEVDYRYEVRIGFSDYTYSNGTWKDTIFTSSSLKESEKYINEHKAYDTPLVIYNLKTGNLIVTSTP
jgi:hypothetical protein